MVSKPFPDLGRYESEKYFYDGKKKEKIKFASIHDPPSVDLTVVVPAYNEEERCKLVTNKIHIYSPIRLNCGTVAHACIQINS